MTRGRKGRRSAGPVVLGVLAAVAAEPSPLRGQDVVDLPGEDRTIHLNLEPLYTVGRLDGDAWEQFQALNRASFDDLGRLHLMDAPSDRIVSVAPDGRFLRQLGRSGEGPGELSIPTGLVALEGGRVAVFDRRKRGFVLFDREGGFVGEVRPDLEAGLPGDPWFAQDDGTVVAGARRLIANGRHSYFTGSGFSPASEGLPILRVTLRDDAPVQVVARLPMPAWDGPGDPPHDRAFEPDPSWGALAGGVLALQHAADYEIRLLRRDGTLLRTLRRPIPARGVTAADREAWRRDIERRLENGQIMMSGGAGADAGRRAREMLEDAWFNPVLPPILEIRTDGRRHLWVQRRSGDDPTREGAVDILTLDGRYVGTVPDGEARMPDAFGPDGMVVFLEAGELDVPLARVYRLPPGLR